MDMLRELGFPEPGEDTFIFQCGPKGMVDANKALLIEAGYDEERMVP